MSDRAIAVLDIGKSNIKLSLVDRETRTVHSMRTRPGVTAKDGPYPHFDVDGLWDWILAGLTDLARAAKIEAIATTTHGAAIVLASDDGLALPVLDYEYDGPEAVRGEYRAIRGDYVETLSPELPNGLNIGRQVYWLARTFPSEFARTTAIMPYPQYWVWRLSGARVVEPTSLGAHTDLWAPRAGTYSSLVRNEGWLPLFPPLAKAWDVVGTVTPDIAAATGLPQSCAVIAGIHDSNASLYPHLLQRQPPFAVLSTGTWIIVFVPGGPIDRLDRERDCLANVDAFGRPVPSVRFMGGREFEMLAGEPAAPTDAEVARVAGERIMALPSFMAGIGPYGQQTGRWTHDPASLSPGERTAVASLYSALVACTCLDLGGAKGPSIVEGPFAKNGLFLGALAQLTGRPVIARPQATGTTEGAALLALGPNPPMPPLSDPPPASPLALDLSAYAAAWRKAVGEG